MSSVGCRYCRDMGVLLSMRGAERVSPAEPLWREAVGEVLREQRHDRGERLADTAGRAGIATQYLSEIERGRKDPSSEVLGAVAGALGLTLRELSVGVARRLRTVQDSSASPQRGVEPDTGPRALAA